MQQEKRVFTLEFKREALHLVETSGKPLSQVARDLGISENTSILTGFPFGHYHYTDAYGPKLFQVPLLVGIAYFPGYSAWALATVLIGDISRKSSVFTTFAVPFIAAFGMVANDFGLNPTISTINHVFIWEQGGGYFGVPFTNYVEWLFTAYVLFQLFALSQD